MNKYVIYYYDFEDGFKCMIISKDYDFVNSKLVELCNEHGICNYASTTFDTEVIINDI